MQSTQKLMGSNIFEIFQIENGWILKLPATSNIFGEMMKNLTEQLNAAEQDDLMKQIQEAAKEPPGFFKEKDTQTIYFKNFPLLLNYLTELYHEQTSDK